MWICYDFKFLVCMVSIICDICGEGLGIKKATVN